MVGRYPRPGAAVRRGGPGQDHRGRADHPPPGTQRSRAPRPHPDARRRAAASGRKSCTRSSTCPSPATTTPAGRRRRSRPARPATRGTKTPCCWRRSHLANAATAWRSWPAPRLGSAGRRRGAPRPPPDFLQPQYRPNRLLTLLNRLKAADRYHGLLLMTATPMQVHPVEVWDLLTVLGLSGRWGADERQFPRLLRRAAPALRRRRLGLRLRPGPGLSGTSQRTPRSTPTSTRPWSARSARCQAELIRHLPASRRPAGADVRQLPPAAQSYVRELARRHTPLRHYVFRNTRNLLRATWPKGIVKDNVPTPQAYHRPHRLPRRRGRTLRPHHRIHQPVLRPL